MIKRRYTVSVRRLVEFILRTGDLAGGRGRSFTANRAAEGMRGHQTVQRSRSVDYESEVPVKHLIESADFTIEIKGRIDGLIRRDDTVLIEEIKTTYANVVSEPDPLHLSQAKVYGAIFAAQNSLKHIALQVSYFHLESGDVTPFRQMYSSDDLQSFLDKLGGEYLSG